MGQGRKKGRRDPLNPAATWLWAARAGRMGAIKHAHPIPNTKQAQGSRAKSETNHLQFDLLFV